MAALDQIVNNMPVANQRRQQQQQAASDLQLQQAVKAVPPKQATPVIASTLGAGAAQNAGQQMVESAKQDMQTSATAGSQDLQQKQADIQQNLAALKRGQDTTQLGEEQQFANLNEQAKREMFDNRMQFQKDELGRTYLNERQLADYATAHARSQQELQKYTQQAEQLSQRKMVALEAAQQKIDQELKFQDSLSNQQQDHVMKQKLIQAKHDLDKKIAHDKAKEANRIGTFSTVVGIGVTAAVVAGTGGAAAPYAPAIYAASSGAASAYASQNKTP